MSLIIDLENIPEDAGLKLDLVERPEHFAIDGSEGSLNREVHVNGTLTKLGRDIFLAGKITTEMGLSCSRCLEALQFPIESKISVCFVPKKSPNEFNADIELFDSDLEIENYSDNTIDLTQSVYDQILLSRPIVRLCTKECKGLCAQCGKNLNKETCDCEGEDDLDPRLAILKKIKNEL